MKYGYKQCLNCGLPLYEGRSDRAFCDDRCGAEWHRNRTPEGAHEKKRTGEVHREHYRTQEKRCENCYNSFSYNVYADRSGQRIPQYCSNKCRQAAYRDRKAGKAKTDQQQKQQGGQKQQQQKQQQKPSWYDILGVTPTSSWEFITQEWRKLIQQYHVDRHMDNQAWASEKTKDVNEAYQELKKVYGKKIRQERR